MASISEPPFLSIGTDVSAKYRGAFCEAKVKKIVKSVKVKVFVKDTQSNVSVTDEDITGLLKVGATVEVKLPDTGRLAEGLIKQMIDSSMYTVVFDDADERTLRRTQLCLKGDKHFTESETLDNLPLSNPEHFGTPVIAKGKRIRTSAGFVEQDISDESTDEEGSPRRKIYRGSNQDLVGKIMFYDSGERKKSSTMVPVLICLPDAHNTELRTKDHLLVKSFKDGKFSAVSRRELISFTRDIVLKNEDKVLKPAMEKALLYNDNSELPVQWNREELIGSDDEDDKEDESSEEDEQSEEKDRFVAQLYKFSDDRGTPINKGPCIGSKDLDLFKLFKVVQNIGGYNRVTNQMKWRLVYSKMLLPQSNTASTQIKNAYKKYLHAFEDFYRKLGSSMGTISRPSRSRHGSGRSIMNFRDKEKTSEKTDSDREKTGDENKSEFDSDAESISKLSTGSTPKRAKSARVKLDMKDIKESIKEEKKDEKPEVKKEDKESKKGEESGRKSKKSADDKKDKKAEIKEEPDKKVHKKKEDGTSPVIQRKKDTEEELKDLQKKISRRRSARMDEKMEEEEEDTKKEEPKKEEIKEPKREKKDEKKEESKDKKKEVKDDKKEEEKVEKKPRRREIIIKKNSPDDLNDSDNDTPTSSNSSDFPVGTKLKVKYGRGRNAREYEAKIIEVGTDPGPRQYLVHYQGWNNRHDEWIKLDRVVKVLERPDGSGSKKIQQKLSPKTTPTPTPTPTLTPKGIAKKKTIIEKPPSSPSSVKSDCSSNQGSGKSGKSTKQLTPAPSPSNSSTSTGPLSKGRPTRSNSIDSKISEGLPAKKRVPVAQSINESGIGSDTENSDKSDDDSEGDKKLEIEVKEELPIPSSSMPSIVSKKPDEEEEEDMEVDSHLDRSPPKLSKVIDLAKEKNDVEEKVEEISEKVEIKEEEPVAPVLNVEHEKNSEPILQKMEAQLNASNAVKSLASLSEEKDLKKKEVDRRIKKIVKDKPERESSPKRTEKANKEEKPQAKELPDTETNPTDEVTEESKDKEEKKSPERKKQVVTLPLVKQNTEEPSEDIKDDSSVVGKTSSEEISKTIIPGLIAEEKESAKSDSEVERRGRKKKMVNKEEPQRDVKKVKVVSVEKKIIDAPNLIEKKVVPSERKPFVTLAEKKQGFSPMVRKVPVVASDKGSEPDSALDNVPSEEPEKVKNETKEDVKKVNEMVVVHKESPVKTEIVVGKKIEISSPVEESADKIEEEDGKDFKDDNINDSQTMKKKVRKKTKRKIEMEGTANVTKKTVKTRAISAKVKESIRKIRDIHKLSEEESAIKDPTIDIDLRCEESIRSRSASPEPRNTSSTITSQESQGFEFFVQTVTSHIHETQQGTSGLSLQDDKSKCIKSNVFENTPPTTPEHDSDGAGQLHSDQIKVSENTSNKELSSKPDTSHNEGHESPRGNASPSSSGSGCSSGVIAGSEGSVDVQVHSNKRRRESEENTPTKRRKRASRGKSAANRSRQIVESDTDETSNLSAKCRSPNYTSDSYPPPSKPLQNTSRSPRPLKYNFNLEEGNYLEGNDRISFLIDKIQEIRKIYVNLKSEVASIDRRRKKLRRRDKESASSSAVEVECS